MKKAEMEKILKELTEKIQRLEMELFNIKQNPLLNLYANYKPIPDTLPDPCEKAWNFPRGDGTCMHDNCPTCGGTGVRKDGLGSCIHMISCPCPKCTPRY